MSATCKRVILANIFSCHSVTIALGRHLHHIKVTHFQEFCSVLLCRAMKNNNQKRTKRREEFLQPCCCVLTVHDALKGQRGKRGRRWRRRRRKTVRNKDGPFGRQSVRVDPNGRVAAAAAASKGSVGRQTSQQ